MTTNSVPQTRRDGPSDAPATYTRRAGGFDLMTLYIRGVHTATRPAPIPYQSTHPCCICGRNQGTREALAEHYPRCFDRKTRRGDQP